MDVIKNVFFDFKTKTQTIHVYRISKALKSIF
jgi:hypothetical protein